MQRESLFCAKAKVRSAHSRFRRIPRWMFALHSNLERHGLKRSSQECDQSWHWKAPAKYQTRYLPRINFMRGARMAKLLVPCGLRKRQVTAVGSTSCVCARTCDRRGGRAR